MKTDYAGIRTATALEDLPTLRDQFAMAALPAIIKAVCDGKHEPHSGFSREIGITIDAYVIADAMMEVRDAKR